MSSRVARVERLTHETQIMVEIDLDGIGVVEVGTGVPFFDHMLAQLGKHGCLDLTVRPRATSRSTRITPWRTPPSRSARR